jgi:mevalonate kinase
VKSPMREKIYIFLTLLNALGALASIAGAFPQKYQLPVLLVCIGMGTMFALMYVARHVKVEWTSDVRSPKDFSDSTIPRKLLDTLRRGDYVYSAPGATFIMGEHSVVFGHPCIYLPIPKRLFVSVTKHMHESLDIRLLTRSPEDPSILEDITEMDVYGRRFDTNHMTNLQRWFENTVLPFLRERGGSRRYGFQVLVVSDFPVACGLNSSGALAAALGSCLYDHFIDHEGWRAFANMTDRVDPKHLLAWSIENCFHSNQSSGAGTYAALHGRRSPYPLIYLAQKRTYLSERLGTEYIPVQFSVSANGRSTVFDTHSYGFDSRDYVSIQSGDWGQDYSWAVLYSGAPSTTDVGMQQWDARDFRRSAIDLVNSVQQGVLSAIGMERLAPTVYFHAKHVIEEIYLNPGIPDHEKSEHINHALRELAHDSMGGLTMLGMNSILSDWRLLPRCMAAYQETLNLLGLSSNTVATIADTFNSYRVGKKRIFGAKMTGSGPDGDVLVLSLLPGDQFHVHFNKAYQSLARSGVEVRAVHFNSSTCHSVHSHVEGITSL